MLRVSPAALHLVVGGGSGRDCPSPEQSRPSTMHLSGAWTDEASANSCNPCDRVSRGHSVGFTQFAVTADRTPRIFANAMSSCGIGYPRPGLARTARPLTYPSKSLPKRELGVSPPRSHPRFGPSCERIGVPTYERCLSPAATGLMIGWCALFDRSAWSVPAGYPEPYLYDRLTSGSDVAVGLGREA